MSKLQIELPDENTLTLAEKVFLALKKGILSREIKPREYLVIGDLAEFFGISRTPVREALIKLEREGWVESSGRRGAKVAVPSSQTFMEMVETQAALEAFMARKAAMMLTDDQMKNIDDILQQSRDFLKTGDLEKCQQMVAEFHTRLYEYIDNKFMLATVRDLEERINRVRVFLWNKGEAPLEKSIQQHQEIMDAIREHNPDKAHHLMLHHTMWFEEELADLDRFL